MSDKLIAQELAQILFAQDMESHNRWLEDPEEGIPIEKDGDMAYDGWLTALSDASDSQIREDLLAVDRDEFAKEWEELAWAQEEDSDGDDDDDDDDYEDDADDDGDIEDTDEEEEKKKKDEEWLDALNGRR